MKILTCLMVEHDLRLVALAAIVIISGGWVAIGLLRRATERTGTMRAGWCGLAAIAAGASIWCTHFIAMLAYLVQAPFTFDAGLTAFSLIVAVTGSAAGIFVALSRGRGPRVPLGGAILGGTIAAMHYLGMLGYRVDGLVDWHVGYVVASVAIGAGLCALSMMHAVERPTRHSHAFSIGFFVAAVVGLHFTGMAAYIFTPMVTGAPIADTASQTALAIAIAGVSSIIAVTGIISFIIDTTARAKRWCSDYCIWQPVTRSRACRTASALPST